MFCGLRLDKKSNELLVFNDQLQSKMIFYCQQGDNILISPTLAEIARIAGLHDLNTEFAADILRKGYSCTNQTMLQGVNRLQAGHYLKICDGKLQNLAYHIFDNTPIKYDEKYVIDKTDELIRQAVRRVVRKNEQYGLRHLFPLSGGIDSRMAQFVAKEYATQPITNFTFAQSDHYDRQVPEQISKYLGNEWQFMPLDGGDYLTLIDECATRCQWLLNYLTPIEAFYFAKERKWSDVGIMLTGVNGNYSLNSVVSQSNEMPYFYSSGMNFVNLGSPVVYEYFTETYSPYCDTDFLDFIYHVPARKRHRYKLYDKWVQQCYPLATQWLHNGERIGHRRAAVTIFGRDLPLSDIVKRLYWYTIKKMGFRVNVKSEKGKSMNPYDGWAEENPAILQTFDSYFQQYKHLLEPYGLLSMADREYRGGTVEDKGKVLTVLSAIRILVGR